MSNIRNSHAHDMMNENIQHFAVSFDYKKESGNARRSGKAYTYKARKGEYKANDLAVVEVKNDFEDDMDNTPGFKIVRVLLEIPLEEVNFQVNYDYGYLVAKIDLDHYHEMIAQEKAFSVELNKLKTNNLRKQISVALLGNSEETEVKALLSTLK